MSAMRSRLLVALVPLLALFAGDAFAGFCIGGQDCPKLASSPVGAAYWAWPRRN